MTKQELALLRQKAEAHDDYLAALRRMRSNLYFIEQTAAKPNATQEVLCFRAGYKTCLMDLSEAVVTEMSRRIDEQTQP